MESSQMIASAASVGTVITTDISGAKTVEKMIGAEDAIKIMNAMIEEKRAAEKAYAVEGTTEDVTACDECGRVDLKKTVALREIETGKVYYFGVVCASYKMKMTQGEAKSEARDADRAASMARQAEWSKKEKKEFATWEEFLFRSTGIEEIAEAIEALGGFIEARQAWRASATA